MKKWKLFFKVFFLKSLNDILDFASWWSQQGLANTSYYRLIYTFLRWAFSIFLLICKFSSYLHSHWLENMCSVEDQESAECCQRLMLLYELSRQIKHHENYWTLHTAHWYPASLCVTFPCIGVTLLSVNCDWDCQSWDTINKDTFTLLHLNRLSRYFYFTS